jgi:LysM repeat protein
LENGVNLNQEIKLPKSAKIDVEPIQSSTKTTISFKDSMIAYTVLPHETMYSISKRFMVPIEDIQEANDMRNTRIRKGDVINIPVKKEKVTKVEIRKIEEIKPEKVDEALLFKTKKEYNVVFLLPFALDGGSNSLRGIATEFLMGAQLALDSLERLGFNAKVNVIDAESDTVKLKVQLNTKEVKSADLIIGPFLGKNVDFTSEWAKANKIRLISPLFSSAEILKDNPYVYNAVNSDITLIEGAAKFLAEKRKTDQIVLVKVDSKDDELYQAFRLNYYASLPKDSKTKLIECSQADIGSFIKRGGNTIFVVPSRDKLYSVKFMNAIDRVGSKAGSGTITVFGTKDWINNEEIKGYYRNKYNLHFASPYDFSYSNEETKKLLKKYRVKYNADLSKYGVQGFDVSMYFIQDFFLSKPKSTGVMNKMLLKSVGPGSGFENKTCFIIKHDNYELVQVDLIYE